MIAPLLTLLVVCAFGQAPPRQMMSHEGSMFTKTTFGNFPCAGQGRVSVAVVGDLTVRGQAREDCYYRIRQRMSAATEKRAVDLMQNFNIRNQVQNDSSYFKVCLLYTSDAADE